MKLLLFVVATLLAVGNYELMQEARTLEKENKTLTELVHRQAKTGDTMLSSLTSCRDTVDFVTTYGQVSALSSMDDDRNVSDIELRKARLDKKKRSASKPEYVSRSPLDRNAADVIRPVAARGAN